MFYHHTLLELMAKERERDVMNFIKNEQMIRNIRRAKCVRSRFRERISIRFADLLIAVGSKIKERYKPMMYQCTETLDAGNEKTCT
jgi:hypothetical protein